MTTAIVVALLLITATALIRLAIVTGQRDEARLRENDARADAKQASNAYITAELEVENLRRLIHREDRA